MVYENNDLVETKRIRAMIYFKYNRNPYFLLLYRQSQLHSGWEFVKGDFDKERDKTLEDTLYREINEETGLNRENFIFKPVKFDLNLPIDFVKYINGVQSVNYLMEVGYPPPAIRTSEEHTLFDWCSFYNTALAIGSRDWERLGDWLVFPRVFIEAKLKGYL